MDGIILEEHYSKTTRALESQISYLIRAPGENLEKPCLFCFKRYITNNY